MAASAAGAVVVGAASVVFVGSVAGAFSAGLSQAAKNNATKAVALIFVN
ncbi:hypothetical protein [Mannheimia haemolytica]